MPQGDSSLANFIIFISGKILYVLLGCLLGGFCCASFVFHEEVHQILSLRGKPVILIFHRQRSVSVDAKIDQQQPSCGWSVFLEKISLKIFESPSVIKIFRCVRSPRVFLSILLENLLGQYILGFGCSVM